MDRPAASEGRVEPHTTESDPSISAHPEHAGAPPWVPAAVGAIVGIALVLAGGRIGNASQLGKLLQFLGKATVLFAVGGTLAHAILMRRLGARRVLRLYFRLITIGLSLSVAVLIGEFALRIVYRDITTTSDFTSWFTGRWLRRSPPQRNALGFRERDFPNAPALGVYRIAVIGDSFAYGQGIAESERMSNLLEAKLNDAGEHYEVLNFGVPGAETKEQLVTLRDVVLPIRPHAVVQQWFTNDVHDNATWHQRRPIRLIPSDFVSGVLHRHSVLYYLVNNQWRTWQYSAGVRPPAHEADIAQFSDPNGPAWQAARQRQIDFIDACRDNGLRLSIVLFPQLTESLGEEYPLNFLMTRMTALLQEHDVPYVDLRDAFSAVRPVSSLWVNTLDWHPNAEANRIATDLLAEAQASVWEADRMERARTP